MDTLQALGRRLANHTILSREASAALREVNLAVRTVEAGQIMTRETETVRDICVLLSGFAMRHKIVAVGRRQILSVDLAGDVLNLDALFAGRCDYNVQAVTTCSIALLDRAAVLDLMSAHESLFRALAVELVRQAAVSREWVANLGSRDARMRVAHLLCEIGVRLEQADLSARHRYELPMTQDQLADAMGLSLIHVGRVLKALEADGLINRERRSISVADWERLRSAGDFNPFYLTLGEASAASAA